MNPALTIVAQKKPPVPRGCVNAEGRRLTHVYARTVLGESCMRCTHLRRVAVNSVATCATSLKGLPPVCDSRSLGREERAVSPCAAARLSARLRDTFLHRQIDAGPSTNIAHRRRKVHRATCSLARVAGDVCFFTGYEGPRATDRCASHNESQMRW